MRDYSCHTVSFIINAFEKSANFPCNHANVLLASLFEPQHEISNNVVYAISKDSDQPAHTNSLIRAFADRLDTL